MLTRSGRKSLDGATADETFGDTFDTANKAPTSVRYWIHATGVTSGATILTEGSYDGDNWAQIASTTVSATGNTTGTITGPVRFLRHHISAYTDGTYTSYFEAAL